MEAKKQLTTGDKESLAIVIKRLAEFITAAQALTDREKFEERVEHNRQLLPTQISDETVRRAAAGYLFEQVRFGKMVLDKSIDGARGSIERQ